tara:strand:- start:49 stop:2226 length:2178 start_codon:yes stop_codon:yes gene_type:complete
MAINYDTASSGGIDQQIQDKADTYRNNPQALQQEYKVSGDLMDLLVLQEMNKRRKAIQNEMAMQMEQKPQSVAEQEYEEAKGGIKDDIVKQTSKLLQEKQKRAATNQQRMMAGVPPTGVPAAAQRRPANPQMMAGITGVPPRAPVNPRGTGIAANRVPSSPTAYGAGGGIVSFGDGGKVAWSDLSPEQQSRTTLTEAQWDVISEGAQDRWVKHFAKHPEPSEYTLKEERGPMRNMSISSAMQEHAKTRPAVPGNLSYFTDSAEEREAAIQGRAESDPYVESMRSLLRGGEGVPGEGIWNVAPEVDPAAAAAASGPTPLSLQQAQNAAQVQVDPNIARQNAFFAGQSASNQPLVADQFDSPAPSLYDEMRNVGKGPLPGADTTRMEGLRDEIAGAIPPVRDPLIAPTTRGADPSIYDKGTAERDDIRAKLTDISNQDPYDARAAAAEFTGNVMDRSGIQGRYDDMIQAQRDSQTRIEADRDKYGMYDAFGDMGQGLAGLGESYTRQRGRYREEDKSLLGTQQELMKAAISSDIDIGKVMVEAGMASEDSVRDSIVSALDRRNNIVTDERQELSEQATRDLNIMVENVRLEDSRIAALQSSLSAILDSETSMVTARLNAQMMREREQLHALKFIGEDRRKAQELLQKAEKDISEIRILYDGMAAEAIVDFEWTHGQKMTPEQLTNAVNKIRAMHKTMGDLQEEKHRKAVELTRSTLGLTELTVTQSP